jgi:hypothetical protein
MPVNIQLFQKARDDSKKIKQEIYTVLRTDNNEQILQLFANPAIKKYMYNLVSGNADHDHIIRMLDDKLDAGQAGLVCQIFEKIGINFIEKLSAPTKLCRAVPHVLNVQSKLLLFHYADISRQLQKYLNKDVISLIYKFAYDISLSITPDKMQIAATSNENPRKLAFGRSRLF